MIRTGMTVRRDGREGAGAAGSFFLLVIGGGVVMVVIGLFLTGLAQQHIIPYFRHRAQTAMERAKEQVGEKLSRTAEPAPEEIVLHDEEEIDNLAAFLTQAETQRKMLEEERRRLERVRTQIDSLMALSVSGQDGELTRQAKLLGGMRPEEAARVLAMMDDGSVRGIIGAMNPRDAAKVVAKMDARRVARLSMTALRQAEAGVQVRP